MIFTLYNFENNFEIPLILGQNSVNPLIANDMFGHMTIVINFCLWLISASVRSFEQSPAVVVFSYNDRQIKTNRSTEPDDTISAKCWALLMLENFSFCFASYHLNSTSAARRH